MALKSKSRRRLRGAAQFIGGCLVIVLVIAAIALMRLQNEPMSAAWISQQVVQRVTALLGPAGTIQVSGSTAFWRGGTAFTISLSDVAVATSKRISGTSKTIDVDVSLTPFGNEWLAVEEIRVVEPDIVVPWPPPLPEPRSPWPAPVGPLDAANRILDAFVEDHGGRLFENLSILRGTVRRLVVADEEPRPWLNGVAGLASISDAGNLMSAVLTGRTSRNRAFDVALERAPSKTGDQGHALSLAVNGFDVPVSRTAAANPQDGFGWLPVDLRAFGDFTADYGIRDVTFGAEIGSGTIPLGLRDSTILKKAEFELAWMPDKAHFQINRAHAEFGDSVIDLEGTLHPDGKDPLAPWQFEFSAQDIVLNPSDVPGAPVILEQIIASGSVQPRNRTVMVDRFSVLSPQAPIEGVGSFMFLETGLLISGASNFGRIHSQVLKRIWPSFIAAGTRRWMLNNVIDGVVDRARIDVSLGPEMTDGKPETSSGAEDAVDLEFDFSGVTIKSFGEMSRVHDGNGSASMSGRVFDLNVTSATIMSPDGKTANASKGRFKIADVYSPERRGEVNFTVEGDNAVVGSIADQEPVRALGRLGVTSDALSGKIAATVDASFPLKKKILAEDVDWVVSAEFDKLSSSDPISGRSIEKADVTVVIDPKMLTMTGVATLDGVRANIQLTEPFGDPSVAINGDLTLTLSEKDRIDRGIDLGDVLRGPVAVGIGVLATGNQQVAVDLKTAIVNIPVFGWTKAKGIPGRATFLLRKEGKRQILDEFKMVAGDAVIEGRIVINGNGRLESADLPRFAVRKGDAAGLKAKMVGKGKYVVDFSARTFDGRGLIKTVKSQQATSDGSGAVKEEYKVSVKADKLIGFNGESLRNVVSEMTFRNNRIDTFGAKADIGKSGITQASGKSQGDLASMTVTTSDSGSLLRFLNIYQSVENGDGFLQYTTDRQGRIRGHITITDFSMQTTKEFSERFAETSKRLNVREDGSKVPVLDRSETKTSFEKFRASFDKSGSRLKVAEAFVRSPLVGGSFAGDIDLKSQRVAMTGTMIPVYGLNNLFGQIPVIGTLMGAGRHGGLVGVTFRISGPINDPALLINPASALAPGIFRKIFEFR